VETSPNFDVSRYEIHKSPAGPGNKRNAGHMAGCGPCGPERESLLLISASPNTLTVQNSICLLMLDQNLHIT